MNKLFIVPIVCAFTFIVKAQNTNTVVNAQNPRPVAETQPYGKIDMRDLEMKTCDFEPDANAEVLFDKGNVYLDGNTFIMERHTRIKIFNEFGKGWGSVRLTYVSLMGQSAINNLEAETINLENGKMEFTKLDKKVLYTETIDKARTALVFALPGVKAGSVIEYKYRVALVDGYFPDWDFQNRIPVRYSEIKSDFPGGMVFRVIPHVRQQYAKEIGKGDDYTQTKALANVHSLPDEPYMTSREDNLQRMEYLGLSTRLNSWEKMGRFLVNATDVGLQFSRGVSGEGDIIKRAKALKSDNEKIAFIFDAVKNNMKWNDIYQCYTVDGTVTAWNKKTGNSAEINIIVFRLLKKAGIKAYPMVVSTKSNGKLNPANPSVYVFNNLVVYIPVDSVKSYVLDASDKYNLFNQIPTDELNTFGLNLDEDNSAYDPVFLQNQEPAIQSVFLNAEISPGGKMKGTVEVNSYSYNKSVALKQYKTDGEEKYKTYLSNNDNNIKITSLKLENMTVDSLPLSQKAEFDMTLSGADENYIYFSPNLFNLMGENPFKKEERFSDIDFGYRDNFSINGIYKLPAGYKADALPKSATIIMPDTSIVFKRIVALDEGTVLVKYVLNHKKTIYFRQDYQDIRGFYKKMYELLNEQIVLKKL